MPHMTLEDANEAEPGREAGASGGLVTLRMTPLTRATIMDGLATAAKHKRGLIEGCDDHHGYGCGACAARSEAAAEYERVAGIVAEAGQAEEDADPAARDVTQELAAGRLACWQAGDDELVSSTQHDAAEAAATATRSGVNIGAVGAVDGSGRSEVAFAYFGPARSDAPAAGNPDNLDSGYRAAGPGGEHLERWRESAELEAGG
jgi:hypothetical protein